VPPSLSSPFATRLPGGRGFQAVALVALVQIALGLAGLAAIALGAEWEPPTVVRDWQRAAVIVVLGSLALYLLQGAGRDVRVAHLGGLFLLIAVFFAHPPSAALVGALPGAASDLVRIARGVTVDAFTPALAWLFVRDFPRTLESRASARLVGLAIGASVAVALGLIGVNLAIALRGEAGALAPLDRGDAFGHYWTVCFALLLPLPPFVLWRTRRAPPDERRRVALFAGGVSLAGVFPVLLAVVPPWFPALSEQVHGELGATLLVPLNLLFILAMAGTTAYAVVVRHVLDVRTVLRKAAQYALARLAVGVLVGLPLAWIALEVYRLREEPIASLFDGIRLLWMTLAIVAIVGVLRIRQRLMVAVDRLFFREPYDPRSVLAALTENAGRESAIGPWAESLLAEVDQALHLESAGLLVAALDEEDYRPVAGTLRRLARGSTLAGILASRRSPLRVEVEPPGELFASLPEDEQVWLVDGGVELLVPLAGTRDTLPGILALGPKRSELPFSREDLLLLETAAGSIAISLENRLLRESAGSHGRTETTEEPASECLRCSRVGPSGIAACAACAGEVRPSTLPSELFGKFRVEERIGQGGMGVVYRAADLTLGRSVALKTLPATSPEDARRLRREARTMAAITHPNLALILGAETWKGTPILVLEYLAGGTLETRAAQGPVALREVLEIARLMARVLERAHGAGILHRDVKPSNIGFTADGVPKLLDFGLARIVGEGAPTAAPVPDEPLSDSGFAGTPVYMCPEAFAMARPGPGFDLWSLGVVAFEAAAGVHPFDRGAPSATIQAIRAGWSDSLRERLPGCTDALADLFSRLLARDAGRRPASAAEMAGWIADVESRTA
jgi:hypothetical protein